MRVRDLVFTPDCLRLTIPKAKTDQLRDCHILVISWTRTQYCPVALLYRYLTLTGLHPPPDEPYTVSTEPSSATTPRWKFPFPIHAWENFTKLIAPICTGNDPSAYAWGVTARKEEARILRTLQLTIYCTAENQSESGNFVCLRNNMG